MMDSSVGTNLACHNARAYGTRYDPKIVNGCVAPFRDTGYQPFESIAAFDDTFRTVFAG